jgi:hypothetical protein
MLGIEVLSWTLFGLLFGRSAYRANKVVVGEEAIPLGVLSALAGGLVSLPLANVLRIGGYAVPPLVVAMGLCVVVLRAYRNWAERRPPVQV